MIGPMTIPRPETAAQAAIAFGRSSAGKVAVMIDSVAGMIAAPPMPITARQAMIAPGSFINAAEAEAAPKIARPMVSTRLRPKRSPSAPTVSSRPAKTSM